LDLLGFIRPNPDFSMGCAESKQKNPDSSQALCGLSQPPFSLMDAPVIGTRRTTAGSIRRLGKDIAHISVFVKHLL
jgi:hypothetical protein